jgi:hypothetical protein
MIHENGVGKVKAFLVDGFMIKTNCLLWRALVLLNFSNEGTAIVRSALEWVLDQYKEKKPGDPTIAEKFNTYRFADYKEKVIDLLKRVCTVSVETMKIVEQMPVE